MVSFVRRADRIQGGLREIRVARSPDAMTGVPPVAEDQDKPLKRKADEIADSEDEEDKVGSEYDSGVPDEFLVDSYELDLGASWLS
jgi:hypothetical protein